MNPLSPAARRDFFVYSSEYERFRWKLADNVRRAAAESPTLLRPLVCPAKGLVHTLAHHGYFQLFDDELRRVECPSLGADAD